MFFHNVNGKHRQRDFVLREHGPGGAVHQKGVRGVLWQRPAGADRQVQQGGHRVHPGEGHRGDERRPEEAEGLV